MTMYIIIPKDIYYLNGTIDNEYMISIDKEKYWTKSTKEYKVCNCCQMHLSIAISFSEKENYDGLTVKQIKYFSQNLHMLCCCNATHVQKNFLAESGIWAEETDILRQQQYQHGLETVLFNQ